MKSATRSVALGTTLVAVALMSGCSSSSKSSGSSANSGGAATTTASSAGATSTAGSTNTKLGKIVYIPGLTGNPFYSTVSCGAGNEAKAKGVAYGYQGSPTFAVPNQTSVVQEVAATKPGAILISIDDPKGMAAPLKAAKAKGIKIITIDGDLDDKTIGISNVQSDGVAGGKLAGVAVGQKLGTKKGSILELDNNNAFVPSKNRTDGFAQGVKSVDPNVTILPVQYTNNGDPSKILSIVEATITAHPDLLAVFGAETANTQGAVTAVAAKGKAGKVIITGYDTSDPIIADLKAGKIFGTVVQNPRGEGKFGVDTAIAAMQGKPVVRNEAADALFVTQANLSTAKAQSYIYNVNCKIG